MPNILETVLKNCSGSKWNRKNDWENIIENGTAEKSLIFKGPED